MAQDAQIDQLRQYLKQLTLQGRAHLLAELERLQLYGEGVAGADVVIAELRAELRVNGAGEGRQEPAERFFFEPLEPVLVDAPPELAGSGRISRGSLPTIWEWMTANLLRAMATDYIDKVKHQVAANNAHQARVLAAGFQAKVVKMLDDTLASPAGAEQIRAGLASYTSLPTFDDLTKMLRVLRARDTLARFAKALPTRIRKLEDAPLVRIRTLLDTVQVEHEDAVPFALTMVARHLKTPWQLIRLATKIAASKEASDVAATPYAIAVVIALDEIAEKRLALRKALKASRITVARDILVEIYDIEYALRVRIDHLEGSPWGRRLDELIAAVAHVVATEVTSIPDNLHHILDSRRLHRHQSLKGRAIYLAWKAHDMLYGVVHLWRRLTTPAIKIDSP
ncbi:MAG: hypothetical protein P4M07_15000 [Xanthobacteraceae bacterium]|nr:hypothetical protein [Xanthobacteraceae bacterium]